MADIENIVQAHIRALGAYVPGKPARQAERESGLRCVKMASNENPFGPSPKALEAMRAAAAQANLYPDNEASELRRRLAERHQLAPDQVMVTDGSTAMLDILARSLLAPGLNAATSERTFVVYPIAARAAGGDLVQVPMRGHTFDLQALAGAINTNTRMVIVANPNNPTGTMVSAQEINRFLEHVPEDVLVVLDEAYCDFGEYFARQHGIEYPRSLDYVRQGRENVIVLRTFSKAHGLAGIRVGYAFGSPRLLQHFARVRTAFSVSVVAEAGGLAALEDEQHIRRTLQNNAAGAEFLHAGLKEMGLDPVPTSANFIYFESPEPATGLARKVQEAGVIVRGLAPWGIPNGIRVTIGTPEQNEQFLAALKSSLKQVATR